MIADTKGNEPAELQLKGRYLFLWRLLNSPYWIRKPLSVLATLLIYGFYRKRLYERIFDVLPDLTKKQIRGVAWGSTKDVCFHMINVMSAPQYKYVIEGENLLSQISKTGAIFASLHIGQVEAPTFAIQRKGYQVCTVIGEGRASPQLNCLGRAIFEKLNVPYLIRGKDVFFKLIGKLRRKESVFIHSDLRGKGLELEFLGKQTTVPKTAAALAVLTKSPLFFTYSIQDKEQVTVYVESLATEEEVNSQQEDREVLVNLLTKRMVLCMERVIKQHPKRWCWLYERFKKR